MVLGVCSGFSFRDAVEGFFVSNNNLQTLHLSNVDSTRAPISRYAIMCYSRIRTTPRMVFKRRCVRGEWSSKLMLSAFPLLIYLYSTQTQTHSTHGLMGGWNVGCACDALSICVCILANCNNLDENCWGAESRFGTHRKMTIIGLVFPRNGENVPLWGFWLGRNKRKVRSGFLSLSCTFAGCPRGHRSGQDDYKTDWVWMEGNWIRFVTLSKVKSKAIRYEERAAGERLNGRWLVDLLD